MTVYLLHFDEPLHHARHYLGFVLGASQAVRWRLQKHMNGTGSVLVKHVAAAGINIRVARVWPLEDRAFERRLKRQKKAWRHCPICRKERAGG